MVWLSNLDDLLIPLPKEGVAPEERFDQKIEPCGIVGDLKVRLFVPFLVTFDYPIYRGFQEILQEAGGFVEDRTVFYFAYDWRLDTRVAAVELAAALEPYRGRYEAYLTSYCQAWGQGADLRACLGAVHDKWPHLVSARQVAGKEVYAIRFNIVTHSLGGLVAQYLVRGLGYGDDVNQLVLIASPSEGTMFAFRIMLAGELAFPDTLFHFYEEKETRPIGFSFPSAFQGLPRCAGAIKPDPRVADYGFRYLQLDLGLTDALPDLARAAEPWMALLDVRDPCWDLICRASRETDRAECERRMRRHLEAELGSSVRYQQTVNEGFCGLDGAGRAFARGKVDEARRAVTRLRGRAPEVAHRPCPDESAGGPPHLDRPVRLYQFFGHCNPETLTFVQARKEDVVDRARRGGVKRKSRRRGRGPPRRGRPREGRSPRSGGPGSGRASSG